MTISVIIATKNRPDKIISCLQALLKNTAKNIEIIVIDQSDDIKTKQAMDRIHTSTVCYFSSSHNGKSSAMNKGLAVSKGEIVAFTDDDCIVSNNWIKEILSTFDKYPGVACITGNTYPYKNIPKWSCPPTLSTKFKIFTKPIYHTAIGFGNNFTIRRSVLKSVGLFKTWLGPGSLSTNCEDGEMILRVLTHGNKILHNPKMVVYHNKQLNNLELHQQNLSYICGEVACYGHFFLKGFGFAKKVIINNFKDSYLDLKKTLKSLVFLKRNFLNNFKYFAEKLLARLRGLIVGFYFTKLSEK